MNCKPCEYDAHDPHCVACVSMQSSEETRRNDYIDHNIKGMLAGLCEDQGLKRVEVGLE